jgi:hypothetical protein
MMFEAFLSPWIVAGQMLAAHAAFLEVMSGPRTAEVIPFPKKFRRRRSRIRLRVARDHVLRLLEAVAVDSNRRSCSRGESCGAI